MANRYWVGGSGDWSDTSHWSLTSGGAGGASVPTKFDDVFIDENSATTTFTVRNDIIPTEENEFISAQAKSLTVSVNRSLTISEVSTLDFDLPIIDVYGDVTLNSLTTCAATVAIVDSAVVTSGGGRFYYLLLGGSYFYFVSGKTISLGSDLRAASLDLYGSTFNTNGYRISGYSSPSDGTDFRPAGGTMNLGSSELILSSFLNDSATVIAGTSHIYMVSRVYGFRGNNQTYYDVTIQASQWNSSFFAGIDDSNTFRTLTIQPGLRVDFRAGTTQQVQNLVANGTSSSQITLRSSTPGSRFTLTKSTAGTTDAYYLDLRDSSVTGGSGWTANHSVDSGNNLGWTFVGPSVPVANFSATPLSGRSPLAVSFTDLSTGIPDSWSWNFGDGTTSSLQHPTKVYSAPGTYSVSLYASNALGGDTETKVSYIVATATVVVADAIGSAETVDGPTLLRGVTTRALDSIESSEAFGSPSLSLTLGPVDSITSSEAVPGPVMITGVKNIFPTPIASNELVESSFIVSVGLVYLLPTPAHQGETFGAPLTQPGPVSMSGLGGIATAELVAGPTIVQSPPPPPPPTDWEAIGKEDEKVYVYRVYESDGTFIGIWTDVEDDLVFTQAINSPGTTTTVRLARSPNTTRELRARLTTQAGDALVTQDNQGLVVTFETNNSVGEGTDVDINHRVDVWVHYGEFDNLTTQIGELLATQSGDYLMAATGAPNGKRVFSGFILDYESLYGAETGVTVTLASHGAELSNELIRDGETIVVDYPSDEIAVTVKDILDTNPGTVGYSIDSIQTTGVSTAALFQLNTKLEGIQSLFSQTPDNFYWFADVADNVLVMRSRSTVPDHRFRLGYHIKSMALKRSQEQLRNLVYFVGEEDVAGVSLLKKYQDTTSQSDWRVGLHRITDRRFSVPASMERRANKEMSRYKDPVFTTTVTISSARYDLESIKLGQMVAFDNVDNFLRDLMLQIVSISYSPRAVTIQLGEVLDSQARLIQDVNDSLQNEQFQRLPNIPS